MLTAHRVPRKVEIHGGTKARSAVHIAMGSLCGEDEEVLNSLPIELEQPSAHRSVRNMALAIDTDTPPSSRWDKAASVEASSLVLIRASSRSMSKSDSDGSAGSSPEDSMIENLVWRDREKQRMSLTSLPEKLDDLKGSPYVGTFHHGHGAGVLPPVSPKTRTTLKRKPSFRKSASDADTVCSVSSQMESSFDMIREVEEMDEQEHRMFMKEALKLEDHVPHTPELCGIQGLLPRKSGVRVLEKIGEGSFGKIVKARNHRNTFTWENPKSLQSTVVQNWCRRDIIEYPHEGETLVLKCIRSACAGDADVECIQREIRIHGRCAHPNIVKMYGHYDHDEYITIILGYVMGKELYSILEMKRRIPEEESLSLFLQMLGAVEHLHSMGVVHRDLKPRNVLVTPASRVYVIDLGLALDLSHDGDRQSWQDPMVGTMGYLAPEMHRQSHCEMGLPVDIWALGVTFYETVCGFPPFQPHEVATPMEVEFPDAEVWGIGVSKALEDLLSKMLEKAPSKRITAAEAMKHPAFTAVTMAEVAQALAAPTAAAAAEEEEAPLACAERAMEVEGGGSCETQRTVDLKLHLTQANSIDWTGQYYFNYCLATVSPANGGDETAS